MTATNASITKRNHTYQTDPPKPILFHFFFNFGFSSFSDCNQIEPNILFVSTIRVFFQFSHLFGVLNRLRLRSDKWNTPREVAI